MRNELKVIIAATTLAATLTLGVTIGVKSVVSTAPAQPKIVEAPRKPSVSIDDLIRLWGEGLGACQNHDEKGCAQSQSAESELKGRGYCYGRATDQSSSEHDWHRCDVQDARENVALAERSVLDRQGEAELIGLWSLGSTCETDFTVEYRRDGSFKTGDDRSGRWRVDDATIVEIYSDGTVLRGTVDPITVNQFNVSWNGEEEKPMFRCR